MALSTPPLTPEAPHLSISYEYRDGNVNSSDVVVMTKPDPEKLPPSLFELLQLQWLLTRIAGTTGTVEIDQFEPYGSDDETGAPI